MSRVIYASFRGTQDVTKQVTEAKSRVFSGKVADGLSFLQEADGSAARGY
jgi:hypothetical protein